MFMSHARHKYKTCDRHVTDRQTDTTELQVKKIYNKNRLQLTCDIQDSHTETVHRRHCRWHRTSIHTHRHTDSEHYSPLSLHTDTQTHRHTENTTHHHHCRQRTSTETIAFTSLHKNSKYTVTQKTAPFYFCNNSVKSYFIWIIIGTHII